MLQIYLTRHGQNVDNFNGILNGHRDEPLTEKGKEQAYEIGHKIKNDTHLIFDVIYSSPLSRAFETAKIIAEVLVAPFPKKEDLLIERDFGIMTGKKISDIPLLCGENIIRAESVTYFLNPEGAETFEDLLKRAQILLDKIYATHESGNILLVCHGDVGKMIYAQYYGLPWKKVLTQFHFGNCDLLLLAKDSSAENSHVFKIDQYN